MCFPLSEIPAINTDLVVALERDAQGEWIGMDSATSATPGAAATAYTDALDCTGPVGAATQTLLVGRRPR